LYEAVDRKEREAEAQAQAAENEKKKKQSQEELKNAEAAVASLQTQIDYNTRRQLDDTLSAEILEEIATEIVRLNEEFAAANKLIANRKGELARADEAAKKAQETKAET